MKITHSELVRLALEQLGPSLKSAISETERKAYGQLLHGLMMHAAGESDKARQHLVRFTDKGQPLSVEALLWDLGAKNFYWRTALIRLFVEASATRLIDVSDMQWLSKIDPILFSALSSVREGRAHLMCFRLLHHYRLEVSQGRAIRFESIEESLQRTPHERRVAMYSNTKTGGQASTAASSGSVKVPGMHRLIAWLKAFRRKPEND
jgi:hypothetical protein